MSILKKIIEDKIKEVENDKKLIPLTKLKENLIKKDNYFHKKLKEFKKNNKTAIVAEVKKASPSKGILLNNFDHIKI
ncbi:MAG: indole-3-glycerol phosphate synthase, partial [Proteobacteria bacterium]|nr:indole-3-glycerol phosphate synthase [Pseudomonadota bacterium]